MKISKCIFYYLTLDIDECVQLTHNCTQKCENENGTFNCACYLGYELMDDMLTCEESMFSFLSIRI